VANTPRTIRRHALRVEQDRRHPLYLFTLTGEELSRIADVSRISRDSAGRLVGYQRVEVKRHIRNIAQYLDSGEVLFPNSLILALPSSVKFKSLRSKSFKDIHATPGMLEISMPRNGQRKPAWIVDGQQRAMALLRSSKKNFPVAINAFVADEAKMQREQFLRINSTRPLPRGLITELLPEIDSVLPSNLAVRRVPSAICDLLNRDPESPFRGLIRRTSSGNSDRGQIVSDTALTRVLQDSLNSPAGCLFAYRNLATNETDLAGVRSVLLTYWNAVKRTFPEAWGLPPTRSRLMHSAGLRVMGRLMDRVMASIDPSDRMASALVRQEVARVRSTCHWTSGVWEGLGLRWSEIQNVASHVRKLSNVVLGAYLAGKKDAA
jgi:DGQHR domain-containing protein